jgi:hypothetical protein
MLINHGMYIQFRNKANVTLFERYKRGRLRGRDLKESFTHTRQQLYRITQGKISKGAHMLMEEMSNLGLQIPEFKSSETDINFFTNLGGVGSRAFFSQFKKEEEKVQEQPVSA